MAAAGDEDDFLMENRQNLLLLLRKLRLTEEDSQSSFVQLQEKRKEAQLMQKTLEEKREAFRERMEVVAGWWRDLRAKEAQLKAHKEKSRRIIKEREEMQVQALKKAIKEREMMMQEESDLLRAKRELEALTIKHQELCNKVQKYSIFKKYLEDVVKISEFQNIQEVFSHHKTLVRMGEELLQSQERNKEMLEQGKVHLGQYTAEKEAEILQYEKELEQLQLRFDQARSDVRFWEARWADIQKTTAEKAQELATIKLAILNIFQSASTRTKLNLNVPLDDSYRQLDMIQQLIQDLQDIFVEVKQKGTKKHQRAALPKIP